MSSILCGDPKQDHQGTFEVYYDLLWNAAYQHDLNKATKQTQRKTFFSQQMIHVINRSLAYCTLFWMSYGRCAMHGLPMGWSEGLSW